MKPLEENSLHILSSSKWIENTVLSEIVPTKKSANIPSEAWKNSFCVELMSSYSHVILPPFTYFGSYNRRYIQIAIYLES